MASVLILAWELTLPGCRSLKQKRSIVRSLRDRLQARFRVSVAETGFQGATDRAEITVALVTSEGRQAESMADKIERYVIDTADALVVRVRRERA